MTVKEKKTSVELAVLLMSELRKHPECDHVIDVAITRPLQEATHHPNWDAAWTVNGNEIVCRRAFQIARKLQGQFDLA
jgi:hypothetical protein